jgi:hypothetical protein
MKSDAKDYVELAQLIYRDACARCSVTVSDLRDLKTLRARVKEEGLSFLTITLPSFASDFERSLADGGVDSSRFLSFRKRGAIPAFLQGMLSQVFDHETGRLRDDSPVLLEVIEGVRQFCAAFKKVRLPCSPAREAAAVKRYISVERDLNESHIDPGDASAFKAVAFVLWNRMLGNLLPDMLLPRHGPGATAEGISGNQKFRWLRWHERLEPWFPFLENGYSISSSDDAEFEDVTFVPEDDEQPVRVVFVPKTLKSPRVIAIEPVCMQYTQQALQRFLYKEIAKDPVSAGHVNFRDQSINRSLALASSKSGLWATIDLSDASDRVPLDLALSMFDSNPELRDAIDACRSRRAELPSGEILTLRKFASMGSALCFPIEAMYFYTICVKALLDQQKLPYTRTNALLVSTNVYVYGDDLIVPSDTTEVVLRNLQLYNCKVNTAKSFWTGKFRESCGLDAYDGYEVTPTYLREAPAENQQQVDRIVSWIATANLFEKRGYWRTASFMFAHVEGLLGELPLVDETSPLLGRIDLYGLRSVRRRNLRFRRRYQSLEQRGWIVAPVNRSDRVDGYAALQKSLLGLVRRGEDRRDPNFEEPDHGASVAHSYMLKWLKTTGKSASSLEHSARRGAVSLKRRWVPVT